MAIISIKGEYRFMELIPVILSGGAGSRLWPVSRELHPKPFMQMKDGESLLQKTFSRAVELPSVTKVITVTNSDLYFKTEDEYLSVNPAKLPTSFILEPFGRNTAPAIASAALQVKETHGDDAVLLVLSADHLIADQTAFGEAVSKAIQLAQQGYLVSFGIQPTFPETGYGYIEIDKHNPISSVGMNCHSVKDFVEKPSFEKAVEYLAAGNYFWNAGIFCFNVQTILAELDLHVPNLMKEVKKCIDNTYVKIDESAKPRWLDPEKFKNVPDVSIDFAVMEKSNKVAVVSCDIGWSDIGSWNAVSEMEQADANGNRIVGDALLNDVTNCYIQNEDRMLAAIGLENLIIVDTADALLVVDKSRAQDVKKIVSQLKQSKRDLHRLHLKVSRPWGTYTVIEEGKSYKIKRIVVKPGASLSLQLHHHRNEHWIVISGTAEVTNNENTFLLYQNESTYIHADHKHRLKNPGSVELVIIEVQSGKYLGEDDIVRFEDVYGRS